MRKAMMAGMAAAAVASAGCAQSRGETGGPTVDRKYQVGAFEAIEVAGPYDVEVRTGSAPSVEARGGEKSIERLVVEVRGGKLLIHPRKRNGFSFGWSRDHKVALTVTVPQLNGAEIAGSGSIRIDKVAGPRFSGGVAGSGDLSVDTVDVEALSVEVAGSGEVRMRSGRAKSVQVEIAGSGDVDVSGVAGETAAVSIAGSGNVEANATRTAKVDIAGSGDVEVTGGAQCTVSKAGSGDVRCS